MWYQFKLLINRYFVDFQYTKYPLSYSFTMLKCRFVYLNKKSLIMYRYYHIFAWRHFSASTNAKGTIINKRSSIVYNPLVKSGKLHEQISLLLFYIETQFAVLAYLYNTFVKLFREVFTCPLTKGIILTTKLNMFKMLCRLC